MRYGGKDDLPLPLLLCVWRCFLPDAYSDGIAMKCSCGQIEVVSKGRYPFCSMVSVEYRGESFEPRSTALGWRLSWRNEDYLITQYVPLGYGGLWEIDSLSEEHHAALHRALDKTMTGVKELRERVA